MITVKDKNGNDLSITRTVTQPSYGHECVRRATLSRPVMLDGIPVTEMDLVTEVVKVGEGAGGVRIPGQHTGLAKLTSPDNKFFGTLRVPGDLSYRNLANLDAALLATVASKEDEDQFNRRIVRVVTGNLGLSLRVWLGFDKPVKVGSVEYPGILIFGDSSAAAASEPITQPNGEWMASDAVIRPAKSAQFVLGGSSKTTEIPTLALAQRLRTMPQKERARVLKTFFTETDLYSLTSIAI